MRLIQPTIFGIALAALIYIDPLIVAGVKFGFIWKSLFFLTFLTRILLTQQSISRTLGYAVLFGISNLIGSAQQDLSPMFLSYCIDLIFISAFIEIFRKTAIDKQKVFLVSFFLAIAVFSVFQSLNLIDAFHSGYEFEKLYGIKVVDSSTGIFSSAHQAGTIYFSAFLFFIWLAERRNRGLNICFASIFAVLLISTYSRLTFLGCLLWVFSTLVFSFRSKKTGIIFLVSAGLGIISIFLGSIFIPELYTALEARLVGERIVHSEFDDWRTLGSGRGLIWYTTLLIIADGGILSWIFGIGEMYFISLMQTFIGLSVIPHNGFLELFACTGIIGIIIYYFWLKSLAKSVRSIKEYRKGYNYVTFGLICSFFTFFFFQSFVGVYSMTIMFCIYSIINKDSDAKYE